MSQSSQLLGSESFVIPDTPTPSDHSRNNSQHNSDRDEVDSIPSISSSILDESDDDESDDGISDAQREWETSLEQLQLLLTMVLVPFAGKYLGRKFAYWSEFCPLISGIGCGVVDWGMSRLD